MSPLHSNILKILYSVALWYSDWRILPVHSLPHEELYRSITYFMNQELKFLRYVMQPEIRITGLSLSGISLQCGGVQDPWLSSVDMYWPALLALAYWPGRQSLEYCWSLLDNFFLNLRCTFLHTYSLLCDAYIFQFILFLIFWTLEGRHGSPKS